MTTQERQNHVEELACELGCVMKQELNMPGMMYVEYEPPYIEGPIIIKQSDYFTMLHELGHVAYGHTQGRPPFEHKTFYFDNGVLQSEAEAWAWAMDKALEEPNNETREFMWNVCMGSYYRAAAASRFEFGHRLWNGNRHYVEFAYDRPTNFFWAVKARMLNYERAVA